MLQKKFSITIYTITTDEISYKDASNTKFINIGNKDKLFYKLKRTIYYALKKVKLIRSGNYFISQVGKKLKKK